MNYRITQVLSVFKNGYLKAQDAANPQAPAPGTRSLTGIVTSWRNPFPPRLFARDVSRLSRSSSRPPLYWRSRSEAVDSACAPDLHAPQCQRSSRPRRRGSLSLAASAILAPFLRRWRSLVVRKRSRRERLRSPSRLLCRVSNREFSPSSTSTSPFSPAHRTSVSVSQPTSARLTRSCWRRFFWPFRTSTSTSTGSRTDRCASLPPSRPARQYSCEYMRRQYSYTLQEQNSPPQRSSSSSSSTIPPPTSLLSAQGSTDRQRLLALTCLPAINDKDPFPTPNPNSALLDGTRSLPALLCFSLTAVYRCEFTCKLCFSNHCCPLPD